MVSHIGLLVELGPICNSMAASLCLKSCEDHNLLKSYNGGLWKNNYRSGPASETLSWLFSSGPIVTRFYTLCSQLITIASCSNDLQIVRF